MSPFAENGRASSRQNRNAHFMKVTTLYLAMSGRNFPRYRAKVRLFTSNRMIPNGLLVDAPPAWTEFRIRKMTPARLRATPPAFLPVMGSFRKIYAKNIVNTGPSVLRMAVSMAVAMGMARRKAICVRNRPKNPARAIFGRSPFSTFSRGIRRDSSQNRADAPSARKVKSTTGDTASEFAMSLQKTMFRPKIV